MKKYITNFSRGCYHNWTCSKAVAELVSNWLDSDGERSYAFTEDSLTLTNANIRVSNKMLMMGLSDKRTDDSKRGMFGQGAIQALVVLTDLDYNVNIVNNDVVWNTRFEHNQDFDEEVLVVDETPYYNGKDFVVTINGLTEDDIDEIKQRCLSFQDREVLYSTKYGDIISNIDGEGEVFCGDMYVCENEGFKLAYNFKPKQLPLNSERSAVSNWDLQDLTAKMIVATGDVDFIKSCIKRKSLDTIHINQFWTDSTPSQVDEDFASEFLEEHGAALITSDYTQHKKLEKAGNKSVYIANDVQVAAIKKSTSYKKAMLNTVIVEREDPNDIVEELLTLLWQEDIIPVDSLDEQNEGVGTDIKLLLYKLRDEGIKWQN